MGMHSNTGHRLLLILLMASLLAGCSQSDACSDPNVGTLYWVFLDTSRSVTPADRDRWAQILSDWLLADLGPGDAVRVFSVGESTASNVPVFMRETEPLRVGAPLIEERASRRELDTLRSEAHVAIRDSLATAKGEWTDLLAALDRVSTSKHRRTVIVFMSDMRNDTQELSLEAEVPGAEEAVSVIDGIFTKHFWSAGALAEVEVHCILDSRPIDPSDPVQRLRLEQFWRVLVERLGGQIATFENYPQQRLQRRG